MRTIKFSAKNRSGNELQIETEGCVINIRINLEQHETLQKTTVVEVIPDFEDNWTPAEPTIIKLYKNEN